MKRKKKRISKEMRVNNPDHKDPGVRKDRLLLPGWSKEFYNI